MVCCVYNVLHCNILPCSVTSLVSINVGPCSAITHFFHEHPSLITLFNGMHSPLYSHPEKNDICIILLYRCISIARRLCNGSDRSLIRLLPDLTISL